MDIPTRLDSINRVAAGAAGFVQDVFLLGLRLYVAWQFLKSGWLKVQDWDTTLFLFEEEYHVPVLSPGLAAALGTAGEILFPLLLVAGLLGRYAALGLFAVNVVAVVAYAHVLFAAGYEGAIAQHYLWGVVLMVLTVFGPGRASVDGWLAARAGNVRRRHGGRAELLR